MGHKQGEKVIKIENYFLDDIFILKFSDIEDGKKFYLGKKVKEGEAEGIYDILSANTSHMYTEISIGRGLWDAFLCKGFYRLKDLEAVHNGGIVKRNDENNTYKIRDRATGLYSSGGLHPTWKPSGKVWNGIGHLKAHLTNNGYRDGTHGKMYSDAEIVEYGEKDTKTIIEVYDEKSK